MELIIFLERQHELNLRTYLTINNTAIKEVSVIIQLYYCNCIFKFPYFTKSKISEGFSPVNIRLKANRRDSI